MATATVKKKASTPIRAKVRKPVSRAKAGKNAGGGGAPGRGSENVAKAGGISASAVEKATGKGWDHWFKVLDKFDVKTNGHKAAAAFLHEKQGVGEWWCQMVVVGYEQSRGLRVKHQTATGFSASVSRTLETPLDRMYAAWQGGELAEWLPKFDGKDAASGMTVRKATAKKNMRITWMDGTNVDVNFWDKSPLKNGGKTTTSKSQAAVEHSKLGSAKDVAKVKGYWSEAMEALRAHLAC